MANKEDKRASSGEKSKKGLSYFLLELPALLVLGLFISALISTLIEWCGMWFGWWDVKGVLHSQMMIRQELMFLNDKLDKNLLEPISGITVKSVFDITVGKVSEFLHYIGVYSFGTEPGRQSFGDYAGALGNMVILTFIRAMVFVFALPMFVLFAWVGLVIGMIERDKRRAGGGRESGAIFQLARASVVPSIGLAWFLYLAWPNSIDPVFIIFPFAVCFGTAIAYMSASFKKYV